MADLIGNFFSWVNGVLAPRKPYNPVQQHYQNQVTQAYRQPAAQAQPQTVDQQLMALNPQVYDASVLARMTSEVKGYALQNELKNRQQQQEKLRQEQEHYQQVAARKQHAQAVYAQLKQQHDAQMQAYRTAQNQKIWNTTDTPIQFNSR